MKSFTSRLAFVLSAVGIAAALLVPDCGKPSRLLFALLIVQSRSLRREPARASQLHDGEWQGTADSPVQARPQGGQGAQARGALGSCSPRLWAVRSAVHDVLQLWKRWSGPEWYANISRDAVPELTRFSDCSTMARLVDAGMFPLATDLIYVLAHWPANLPSS
jgi:hypothetical protein